MLVFSILGVGTSLTAAGVRSFLSRRERKVVARSASGLARDAAKELHERAWALAGGDQNITPLHHRLDTAYASVSALVLDMGESGRVPYEGPSFEDRLRSAVADARAGLDSFEAFKVADPERATVELNSTRTLLETVIKPRVAEAGLPWMSDDLEAQWRHLNWEPYSYVQPGGGAAAFAEEVERYVGGGRSDDDLFAALKRVKGEIEDRRDCVYVIGLLIDFTFDLAMSFGGSPKPRPSGR
jgi:hypothetical protein